MGENGVGWSRGQGSWWIVIVNGGFVLRKVLSVVFATKRQSELVTWSKSTMAKTAGDKRNAEAKVLLRTDHTTAKDAGECFLLLSLNNTTMLDSSHYLREHGSKDFQQVLIWLSTITLPPAICQCTAQRVTSDHTWLYTFFQSFHLSFILGN